jgi:hypothetical protein
VEVGRSNLFVLLSKKKSSFGYGDRTISVVFPPTASFVSSKNRKEIDSNFIVPAMAKRTSNEVHASINIVM